MRPKQEGALREYLVDFNITQAMIRTGYSEHTARAQGGRLLSKVEFQDGLRLAIEKQSQRTGVTADKVLHELAVIAFSDMSDYVAWGPDGVKLKDSSELGDLSRVVSEVSETTTKDGGSLKFKLHDKVKALDMVGKHLGMWPEKPTPAPIIINQQFIQVRAEIIEGGYRALKEAGGEIDEH